MKRSAREVLAAKVPRSPCCSGSSRSSPPAWASPCRTSSARRASRSRGAIGVFGFVDAMWLQPRRRVPGAGLLVRGDDGRRLRDDGRRRLQGRNRLSYAVTTPFFTIVLTAIFYLWHRSEGTLSIHSITTRGARRTTGRAVLATFALGTAAGDLTAITLTSASSPRSLLFGAVIAIPALAWWRGWLNPIVAFWAAYVITRPLGASFVDWLGKPTVADGPRARRRDRQRAGARRLHRPRRLPRRSAKRDIQMGLTPAPAEG